MRSLDYGLLVLILNVIIGFPSKHLLPVAMYEAQALVRFSIIGAFVIAVVAQESYNGIKRVITKRSV